jgi:hypothetical protein
MIGWEAWEAWEEGEAWDEDLATRPFFALFPSFFIRLPLRKRHA